MFKNRIIRSRKHLQKTAGQNIFPFFSYKATVKQTNRHPYNINNIDVSKGLPIGKNSGGSNK